MAAPGLMVELRVEGIPQVVQALRHEFAQVAIAYAGREANQLVATRLREIAAEFDSTPPAGWGSPDKES